MAAEAPCARKKVNENEPADQHCYHMSLLLTKYY